MEYLAIQLPQQKVSIKKCEDVKHKGGYKKTEDSREMLISERAFYYKCEVLQLQRVLEGTRVDASVNWSYISSNQFALTIVEDRG